MITTVTFINKAGDEPPLGPFTVPGDVQLTYNNLRVTGEGWIGKRSDDPDAQYPLWLKAHEGMTIAYLDRETQQWVPLLGSGDGPFTDVVIGTVDA